MDNIKLGLKKLSIAKLQIDLPVSNVQELKAFLHLEIILRR